MPTQLPALHQSLPSRLSPFTRVAQSLFATIGPRFALIASLLLPGAASAEMRIDKAIVYFESGSAPRQDVEVSNLDDENLYLEVEVMEVRNPGTDTEERVIVKDVEGIGFIASPAKSIIAPGARRRVRLLNLLPPSKQERIYRVTFRPVLPEFTAQNSAVKLLVAYQSLVIIKPAKSKPKLESSKEGGKLVLSNTGNANLFLQEGKACIKHTEQCAELPSKRLYANNSWQVPIPEKFSAPDAKVSVSYVMDNGSRQLRKEF